MEYARPSSVRTIVRARDLPPLLRMAATRPVVSPTGTEPVNGEAEFGIDALGKRRGDVLHPVGEEGSHGEELAGVDLGQDGGDAEVGGIEAHGGVDGGVHGIDAGVPGAGCALGHGLPGVCAEAVEGVPDGGLEGWQRPCLVIGGRAGEGGPDVALGAPEDAADLGGGVLLDAGQGAGAAGSLALEPALALTVGSHVLRLAVVGVLVLRGLAEGVFFGPSGGVFARRLEFGVGVDLDAEAPGDGGDDAERGGVREQAALDGQRRGACGLGERGGVSGGVGDHHLGPFDGDGEGGVCGIGP